MKKTVIILLLFAVACEQKTETVIAPWIPYDESQEIEINADHESRRMQYKLIQSRVLDKNDIWKNVAPQIRYFSEEDYLNLKPLILEQDIPTIQSHIKSGKLSYESLTQWYLYRIVKYENDSSRMLNAIIDINPNAVFDAKERDKNRSDNDHPIYGMPIILKDNINTEGMPTTAGAQALSNNYTSDAFITERIKEKGGIILGKANLSEWANYFTLISPNGYSAVGGQTLNPYGRKIHDTGGSSSGSGASMAANYAVAAVGTETSGSILSPSSSNSIVGLKPTIGLLSRGGIVPISSTLDTPGPMTRSVIDNAILLSAMSGEDSADAATKDNPKNKKYWQEIKTGTLEGLRFGVSERFLEDSIYRLSIEKIESFGGVIIEYEPVEITFENFGTLLMADMMVDLPNYLHDYAGEEINFQSISDIVNYNLEDSLVRIPYGQGRFDAILEDDTSHEELMEIKSALENEGRRYFDTPMVEHDLDAVLSINNWSAGYAAVAKYPCLTVPMGYTDKGRPMGLTFIGKQFEEDKLLKMGFAFEQATKSRKQPGDFN
jgi:amidase